jgi:hypothetical protein
VNEFTVSKANEAGGSGTANSYAIHRKIIFNDVCYEFYDIYV